MNPQQNTYNVRIAKRFPLHNVPLKKCGSE